jgi:hypothetical protein
MKQAVSQVSERYVRIASFVLFAWTLFWTVGDASARSHRVKNQPVIRVRIYNYAQVHLLDLCDAERHAAYLFARAGVRIAWTVYSAKQRTGRPQSEGSGTDFVVRILPPSMSARCNHKPGELGQSLVPSGVHGPTPGGIAHVFYENVKVIASESGSFFGEVLGDAMAHELGHLLLGFGHSAGKIMKARWTVQDLRIASQGGLPFSPAQVVLLQRAARSLRQNPSSMLAAQR